MQPVRPLTSAIAHSIRYVLDVMGDTVRTEAQFDAQDGLYDCAWSEENENHM